MSPDTEIRHLRPSERRCLAEMLDTGDHWRSLAAILPRPDGQEGYLLTSKSINLLEQQKSTINGSPTRALLDYWGTCGRKRPTIKDLLDYLVSCKLYQAADYVSINLLNCSPVNRDCNNLITSTTTTTSSTTSSASPIKTSETIITNVEFTSNFNSTDCKLDTNGKNLNQLSPKPSAPDISTLSVDDNLLNSQVLSMLERDSGIKRFSYNQLSLSTNNFSNDEGDNLKLGEGAFGSVYLATDSNGLAVAVKLIKEEYGKQFIRELDVLTRFNHPNLLSLLGIACEGANLCLVYEYMPNGSLADRLACAKGSVPIPWKNRVRIIIETAKGLDHLHSHSFIHRDVKSANILLDQDWTPKLGDFGLARHTFGESGSSSINLASTVMGTSIYMAPEAFRGHITSKMDIYSFGIVILELLTGQPPFDPNRPGGDILSWSQEVIADDDDDDQINEDNLKVYLDSKAGNWDVTIACQLMLLSRKCTEYDKKERLDVKQVLNLLEKNINIKM